MLFKAADVIKNRLLPASKRALVSLETLPSPLLITLLITTNYPLCCFWGNSRVRSHMKISRKPYNNIIGIRLPYTTRACLLPLLVRLRFPTYLAKPIIPPSMTFANRNAMSPPTINTSIVFSFTFKGPLVFFVNIANILHT